MFHIQKIARKFFINVRLKYSILPLKAAGQILLSIALLIMRIIDEKLVMLSR